MNNPLVSIIIPTYNRAMYIAETIESVLNQTYKDIEIIIIDDGSTDNTYGVVKNYGSLVSYVVQENSERGAARNHGLRLSNGDFIAFLDSDDLWLPDKLDRELDAFLQYPSAGVVYSGVELIDEEGKKIGSRSSPGINGWVTPSLLQNNFISLSANLIRTVAIKEVGGFREERELAGSEDWELWVRLSTKWQFISIPGITVKYRTHTQNTMSNASGMERSMWNAYQIMESANYLTSEHQSHLHKTRSTIYLSCAINYCVTANYQRSWKYLLDAAKSYPKITLDPRFTYTVMNIIFGSRLYPIWKFIKATRTSLSIRNNE